MLLDILFPKLCIECKKYGEYICTDCQNKITRHKQICIVCKRISLQGKTHDYCQNYTPLDGVIIATEYKALVKNTLHKIKYNLSYDILNELMNKTLISEKIRKCIQTEELQICTEIPMHAFKENKRGFNQAKLICEWLQKNYSLPHQTLLTKKVQTTPQMQLKRQHRIFNLKDAFQILPTTDIKGKNILLCDDVTTTATTLEEAAKILKLSDASKVYGLVIASGR
jgi:ComF family protein